MSRYAITLWPRDVQTVAAMLRAQERNPSFAVKAICRTCKTAFVVDLDLVAAMRGRGFSLINKLGRCKVYGCGGETIFLWKSGGGTPFRPLLED